MRTRSRADLSRCHLMADGDICHQMTIAFDNAATGDAMNAHHVIFYVARLNAHTAHLNHAILSIAPIQSAVLRYQTNITGAECRLSVNRTESALFFVGISACHTLADQDNFAFFTNRNILIVLHNANGRAGILYNAHRKSVITHIIRNLRRTDIAGRLRRTISVDDRQIPVKALEQVAHRARMQRLTGQINYPQVRHHLSAESVALHHKMHKRRRKNHHRRIGFFQMRI